MPGFVTHTEYQKHIRGEWRTIHNLWPHIRKYVPGYGYSKTEIDAMFAGTEGSIAFADATGFIAEDNTNLFWDAAQHFLGVGVGAPVCRMHIRGAVCADYTGLNPDTVLLLENDDNVVLQLQAATNGEARIVFADDKHNPPAGRIMYKFADDEMVFGVGTDDMVVIGADGANSRITSSHRGIRIDSTSYATFIADAHNADAYLELQEDNALKWTVGFDFSDSLKFQICQDAIGSAIRFEIEPGIDGLINLYQDVGIRNSQDLRFYNNGNYVGFKAPVLGADFIWALPTVDGPANEVIGTDNAGQLIWRTHDELAGFEAGEHFTMLDEDDLVSDSDTQAATQQSIKAYVDAFPGATDEKVKVDAAAAAGYLGAAENDGVLRVDAPLTYADGGDFVTLGVDSSAIKLDDLGAPDDNTDLDFSTAKHGLVPKGTDVGNFLKDDGTWAAGGGGESNTASNQGSGTSIYYQKSGVDLQFNAIKSENNRLAVALDGITHDVELTLTEGNIDHDALANTHANPYKLDDLAAPDDNTDLDFSTTKHGLVPKGTDVGDYLKDDGTWDTPAGDGVAAGPVLIFDSGFDDLALGNIHGKGAYSYWGTWVNASGADCTAEIVVDPGGGQMLRLDDQSGANSALATLTMSPDISAEILIGMVEWKLKVSALAANSRGYFYIRDKDAAATGQGGFFRGDSTDVYYRSSSNVTGKLVDVAVDTWYVVRTLFNRIGNYSVWWVDGTFEQGPVATSAGEKFDFLELETREIYSGNVFDIKYIKVWSLHYV